MYNLPTHCVTAQRGLLTTILIFLFAATFFAQGINKIYPDYSNYTALSAAENSTGFVINAQEDNTFLTLTTDENGNFLDALVDNFQPLTPPPAPTNLSDVKVLQSQDGNFFFAGNEGTSIVIVKKSPANVVLFENSFTLPVVSPDLIRMGGITEREDGKIIITGSNDFTGSPENDYRPFFMKFDFDGSFILWNFLDFVDAGSIPFNNYRVSALLLDGTGGGYLTAFQPNGNGIRQIIRATEEGSVIYNINVGNINNSLVKRMLPLGDGRLAIQLQTVGGSGPSGTETIRVFAADGTEEYSINPSTILGVEYGTFIFPPELLAFSPTVDGGFLVTGIANGNPSDTFNPGLYIIKTDAAGTAESTVIYPDFFPSPNFIIEGADGAILTGKQSEQLWLFTSSLGDPITQTGQYPDLIRDIASGSDGSDPIGYACGGDRVYFLANRPEFASYLNSSTGENDNLHNINSAGGEDVSVLINNQSVFLQAVTDQSLVYLMGEPNNDISVYQKSITETFGISTKLFTLQTGNNSLPSNFKMFAYADRVYYLYENAINVIFPNASAAELYIPGATAIIEDFIVIDNVLYLASHYNVANGAVAYQVTSINLDTDEFDTVESFTSLPANCLQSIELFDIGGELAFKRFTCTDDNRLHYQAEIIRGAPNVIITPFSNPILWNGAVYGGSNIGLSTQFPSFQIFKYQEGTTTDLTPPNSGNFIGQFPKDFTVSGETLFFTTGYPFADRTIWKTDGTEEGTNPVFAQEEDLFSSVDNLIDLDGSLYFSAYDGSNYGWWRTDGSPEGTEQVLLFPASENPNIQDAIFKNGRIVFTATAPAVGREPWSFLATGGTINPPQDGTDLELTITSSDPLVQPFNYVTLTATIENTASIPATNVVANFNIPNASPIAGEFPPEASQGTLSGFYGGSQAGIWNVGTIAPGTSKTFEITFYTLTNDNTFYGQIQSMTELDNDSTPGNGTCCTANEDDEFGLNFPNLNTGSGGIQGKIWLDANRNGILESSGTNVEDRLGGITILLFKADDLTTIIDSQVSVHEPNSTSVWDYFFENLSLTETYVVQFTGNANYLPGSFQPTGFGFNNQTDDEGYSREITPSSSTPDLVNIGIWDAHECTYDQAYAETICDDNGTPSDSSDDTFRVEYRADGEGDFNLSIPDLGLNLDLPYFTPTPYILGNYSTSIAPFEMQFTNRKTFSATPDNCGERILITPPNCTIEAPCQIQVVNTSYECIGIDDVAQNAVEITLQVEVNNGANQPIFVTVNGGQVSSFIPTEGLNTVVAGQFDEDATFDIYLESASNSFCTTSVAVNTTNICTQQGSEVDLQLSVSGTGAETIYSSGEVTFKLTNNSSNPATGIQLEFAKNSTVNITGEPEATQGNATLHWTETPIWNVGSLAANSTAEITFNVFSVSEFVAFWGQVNTQNELDVDSTPGNGISTIVSEDDEASYPGLATGECSIEIQPENICVVTEDGIPMVEVRWDVIANNTSGNLVYSGGGVNGTITLGQSNYIGTFPIDGGFRNFILEDAEDATCQDSYVEVFSFTCNDCAIDVEVSDINCENGFITFIALATNDNTASSVPYIYNELFEFEYGVPTEITVVLPPGQTATSVRFTDRDYEFNDNCAQTVVVSCEPQTGGVDLDVVTVDVLDLGIYQTVPMSFTIYNTGTETATGVEMDFAKNNTVNITGTPAVSQGTTFEHWTENPRWTVGTLAPGASATIDFNIFTISEEVVFFGQVSAQNETDIDSTPGNGTGINVNEDDEAVFPNGGGIVGECSLTVEITELECTDPLTPGDFSDDFYGFTVNVDGQNTSGQVDIFAGGFAGSTNTGGAYGYSGFLVADGPIEIFVIDELDAACTTSTVVIPPTACATQTSCIPTVTLLDSFCTDNGTPADSSDDLFNIFVGFTTESATGVTENIDIYVNGNFFQSATTPVSLPIQDLSIAEGDVFINFFVTGTDNGCGTSLIVSPPSTCSEGQNGEGPDLNLSAVAQQSSLNIYSNGSSVFTLTNEGTETTNFGVNVKVELPEGLVYQGGNEYTATKGEFTDAGGTWFIADGLAVGETAELTINYFTLATGGKEVYAQVTNMTDGTDPDSVPFNGTCCTPNEDDEAVAVITVNSNFAGGSTSDNLAVDNLSMIVYPVPVQDILTIELQQSESQDVLLTVRDVHGKIQILQSLESVKGQQKTDISVADFAPGIYLLTVENEGERVTQRFVKM